MKKASEHAVIHFIFMCFLSICSCSYNKAAPIPESASCRDSAAFSYSLYIQPIIRTNCYSCHSTSITQTTGALDLENYNSFNNFLKLDFRGDHVFGSMFYNCILQTNGALPMPPSGKLTDCEIKKIKKWIDSGAPNN